MILALDLSYIIWTLLCRGTFLLYPFCWEFFFHYMWILNFIKCFFLHLLRQIYWGFPHSSVCKESTCNAGNPSLIPGLGRSTGEGIGYPLQYSWASPVAQLVKNPAAMWDTWVWSLDWEDSLEKGKRTHSSILAWRIPWTVYSMGSQRVRHDWTTFTFTFFHWGNYMILFFILVKWMVLSYWFADTKLIFHP